MEWIKMYANVLGLSMNILGALILTVAQNPLFDAMNIGLQSLDFTVETWLHPSNAPVVRFEGLEKQMKRAERRSRMRTFLGWIIIILGFFAQIPSALPK